MIGYLRPDPIPRSTDDDDNRGMKSESGFRLAMQWRASPLAQTHQKYYIGICIICVRNLDILHILLRVFVEVVTHIC